MTVRYLLGDTRERTAELADGSVDLIFTSPPFLALRSYLPADHPDKALEIGSEPNPAAFLDTLLELTAEWRRVLAPHGTLAVELGDTYSGVGQSDTMGMRVTRQGNPRPKSDGSKMTRQSFSGWPLAKSLACIPQLYQTALAYGINPLTGQPSPAGKWRVRNVIAWHRPNPAVGALGDKFRPASSSITVACTGQRRWFDLDAVRVPHVNDRPQETNGQKNMEAAEHGVGRFTKRTVDPAGAPPLDWHTDGDLGVGHIILSTQPYAGAHYATWPTELCRKVIECMCPRQVCRECGVARERMVAPSERYANRANAGKDFRGERGKDGFALVAESRSSSMSGMTAAEYVTLGWSDCGHDNYRPGVVFDPFAGSGATLEAAQDLGRDAIGVDLDPRNVELARERVGMFLEVDNV